jgi:hypothetical protein
MMPRAPFCRRQHTGFLVKRFGVEEQTVHIKDNGGGSAGSFI